MPYYYRPSFEDELYNLRHIHSEVSSMRNGIRRVHGPGWEEYSPSDFLYSFIVFNTLYGIDWKRSRTTLIRYRNEDCDLTESQMQEEFLKYCFNDNRFVEYYKEYFINYLLMDVGGDKEKIMDSLAGIRFGHDRKNTFLNNFESLLSGSFNYEIIKSITYSLYLVRCNIFHGSKSIRDLRNTEQRKRLAIYTSFFIALNQMLFSYLDYKNPSVDFTAKIKEAFDGLQKNRADINDSIRKHQLNK